MSNIQLRFTLKQHSPIIHFQHDERGATLRATELKPKLDRFLLEKEPGLPCRTHPNGDRSLDYRVKVVMNGINNKDHPKPYVKKGERGYVAPYFAENPSIEHSQNVTVSFLSFNPKIIEAINTHFPLFLSVTNFGTRQSKGFGSYHLEKMDQRQYEKLLLQHTQNVFRINKPGRNPKDSLKIIDSYYRHLKSGINFPNYKKSILFEYMCDNKDGYGWEKRKIKEKFPEVIYGDHSPVDCTPPKEYRFIRALLGLAEHNEYYPYGPKKKLQVKISSNEIDRFRSPLTFKIFDNHIYILPDTSYRALLNKKFTFSLEEKSFDLLTPDRFDIVHFLDYAAKKYSFLSRLDKEQK